MKVEYINPFVEGTCSVLAELLSSPIARGKLSLITTPINTQGVAVLIGITGDVEGRVVYDMSEQTAIKIAAVMNGEELATFNDLAKSTISELANMITGRAITALNNKGYNFDITPPALFSGENMQISNLMLETLVIPLQTSCGNVIVNVAMRQRAK